jgi:hypothetical protein
MGKKEKSNRQETVKVEDEETAQEIEEHIATEVQRIGEFVNKPLNTTKREFQVMKQRVIERIRSFPKKHRPPRYKQKINGFQSPLELMSYVKRLDENPILRKLVRQPFQENVLNPLMEYRGCDKVIIGKGEHICELSKTTEPFTIFGDEDPKKRRKKKGENEK